MGERLMGRASLMSRASKTKTKKTCTQADVDRAWLLGYASALASIARAYDRLTEVRQTMICDGITYKMLAEAGVDSFDQDAHRNTPEGTRMMHQSFEIDALGEVDVDGMFDERRQIQYLGKARKQPDGTWRCLANVGGCLCLVEVKIRFKDEE